MNTHQTYQNSSSRGHEEVLYLFESNSNPRWLLWPWNFQLLLQNYCMWSQPTYTKCCCFSKSNMAVPVSTRHSRNVSLGDPMCFYNGENLISAVSSQDKFIYIHIISDGDFPKNSIYCGSQFYWWGNWSTQRIPQTCHKSQTNFIT